MIVIIISVKELMIIYLSFISCIYIYKSCLFRHFVMSDEISFTKSELFIYTIMSKGGKEQCSDP